MRFSCLGITVVSETPTRSPASLPTRFRPHVVRVEIEQADVVEAGGISLHSRLCALARRRIRNRGKPAMPRLGSGTTEPVSSRTPTRG